MMTTANNIGQTNEKITALYCRLSVEDLKDKNGKDKSEKEKESNSITNQKQILADYAKRNGYTNTMFFVDDGISGTSFERDDFQRMQKLAEEGKVGTIIVKDLSRFGREQVEAGRLTQIVYPSLGITFISIQENVNSSTGEGMEMMPFYNIFNEWYAAQTSKKIRTVWQSKAEHGKRISATVPYGYVKDPNDKEKWLIDEPAASVVRKIYDLCLAGNGPSRIARILDNEKVLCPTSYYERLNRTHVHTPPKNPYFWQDSTVAQILENRQYTGCAVNFKSTTVSYKVHKVVYNAVEDYQIIPNMQEPIIDEDTWLRVQELRKNKRRPTATGRTSLFSGLVFCADCGSKLRFHAAKSMTRNQEHFCCGKYKSGRGECTIHYIRDVVLQRIVTEAIGNLADFVRCYEPVFLFMLAKKNDAMRQAEFKRLTKETEDGAKRLLELDRLIAKTYENNVLGKISDELYEKLMRGYETEQKELTIAVAEGKKKLEDTEQQKLDVRLLIKTLREMTNVKELTPTIVNSLIQRIEVHNNDKYDGHCHVKVDIYFTAVGLIDIPTEEEILTMTEEIKNDPQKFRISA